MKSSNCSSSNNSNINNQNKNMIKFSNFKYHFSNAKLNYKMINKSNKTSKPSPLSKNNKNQNKYNLKKIDKSTPTVVFSINSSQKFDTNHSKTKSQSKSKEKKTNISHQNSKTKIKQKVNYISSNNNILKPKEKIINKNQNHKNQKNQIHKINIKKTKNEKCVHYNNIKTSSSFSNNKSPQVGLKYLNDIMKKINLNSYKTTPITAYQSKKVSKEKNNIKRNLNVQSSSHSNSKSKSTSVTKIKNIVIPTMNNFKSLLSKYSAVSHLTTNTINNNISHNEHSEKKKENNFSISSKSYAQQNNKKKENLKKNHNKKKEKNKNNSNVSYKYNINKCYYQKININLGNLYPFSSSHYTIKNESKSKNELIKKNENNKKNSNSKNNMFNFNIHLKKNGYTGNNNTKLINKLNNNNINNSINRNNNFSSTLTKNSKNNSKKNSKPKTSNCSLIYENSKKNKLTQKNKEKEKEKEEEDKDKEIENENEKKLSHTNSISSFKDINYYKNESKKLSEKIKNYSKKNNNEYPETTLEYYKIGRCVGHGAFGKVNISLHILSGRIVAIKSINKQKGVFSKKNIQYEINLMKKLRGHKNIITLFEKFEDKKYYFIVMENAIGGNLLKTIKKMTKIPENTSKKIFKQIIKALKFIHSKNIVHRDIKPHNILLDLNSNIKICDFGVGKEIKKGNLVNETCGTPAYVAPELLSGNFFDPFKADVWSCGVVLYFMLTGIVPFRGDNDMELHNNIIKGIYPKIDSVSFDCEDLIKKILEVDPSKRFSLDDILNHKWIKSLDNKKKNCEISLFTKAEKIIFGKLNIDYRNSDKENLVENFTYKNLDSELDDDNKNIEPSSNIQTPNNTKIQPYYNDDEDIYFSDLLIKDNIMKFNLKVRELNLNYEVKYNADIDQGFVRNDIKGNRLMRSLNNSINEDDKKENKNNKNNKEINLINLSSKKDDNDEEILNTEKKNSKEQINYNFNENALKFVEEFGYKREYIIKSLKNNELNHCTATYYLKLTLMDE